MFAVGIAVSDSTVYGVPTDSNVTLLCPRLIISASHYYLTASFIAAWLQQFEVAPRETPAAEQLYKTEGEWTLLLHNEHAHRR